MDFHREEHSSPLNIRRHRQAYQSSNRYGEVPPGNGIYDFPNHNAQNPARASIKPLHPSLHVGPGVWRMEQQPLQPQPSQGSNPLTMYNRNQASFASSSASLGANASNRNAPIDRNGTPPTKRAKTGKGHMTDKREPPRTSQACDHCKVSCVVDARVQSMRQNLTSALS
jgi:hypothetical protein